MNCRPICQLVFTERWKNLDDVPKPILNTVNNCSLTVIFNRKVETQYSETNQVTEIAIP